MIVEAIEVYKKRLFDVEAENKAIRKDLVTYKKALELACDEIISHRICTENYCGEDTKQVIEWILEEARED